jgi:capsular polysaccharide export protein
MEDFYSKLHTALEIHQSAMPDSELKIVIKEHPSWPKSFTQLHHAHRDIIFANHNSTQSLIEGSEAVITINSTVGIESLLLGKKVITLGNSFLNIEGVVQHATDQEQLNQLMLNLDAIEPDQSLITRFLQYIKYEYLIAQDWRKLEAPTAHFEQVKNRLEHPFKPI